MPFSFFTNLFQQRREELEELAYQLGMDFSSRDRYGLAEQFYAFDLFRRGRRRTIKNVLYSRDELGFAAQVSIFDYEYTISSGKSTRQVKQTVFYMRSPELELPKLLLQPENFFHKIGTFFGMQDIDFEEFPNFSKRYLLQGDNEKWIRQMMNDRLLHFFTIEKNWSMEGVDDVLVFYRSSRRMPPEQIEDFYLKGLQIGEMMRDGYGGELV